MLKLVLDKIVKSFFSTQFIRFLLVGGTAALVNFFSRFAFRPYFSNEISIALAFSAGTLISFIFNKTFTFKANNEKTTVQMAKFLMVALISIVIATLVAYCSMSVYRLCEITLITEDTMEIIAHIIAIGITTIYNFLAMKFFSFRKLGFNKNATKLGM